MENPLTIVAESEMKQHGIGNAALISELYESQSFGNAEAIYRLGNLQLRFLRDRGDDTVSIGSSNSPQHMYVFDDVAVLMGWLSLEELLKYDEPVNFDVPPRGPFHSLSESLSLIKRDFERLERIFSTSELSSTQAKLNDIARVRVRY